MTNKTDLDRWIRLMDDDATPLRREAAACDPYDAAAIERLRRHAAPDLVRLALVLAAARRKAAGRLDDAANLVADPEGVEQATSTRVARHKARRFDEASIDRVVDMCCGIGGDATAMHAVTEVEGIDLSAVRAWMTGMNAGCSTRVTDVTSLDVRDVVYHLDPARRVSTAAGGTRRAHGLADYVPGPEFIASMTRRCPTGAVKLGPGVDLDTLAPPDTAEVEFVNDGGTLVQAILWTGRLARHTGERSATRLPDDITMHGSPAPVPSAERDTFDRYLHVVDPAVERAGLGGLLCQRLGIAAPHIGVGLLTSDEPVPSAWLNSFAVHVQLPWKRRRIQDWLAAHDAGVVEVKTRGRAIDTDRAQADLRGTGRERWTVFCLRFGNERRAVITRRQSDDERQADR